MLLNKDECLAWCYGDLLDNANRGKVAEFIIAKACGVADSHRQEWDSVDLHVGGVSVEVKSSAYLQTWHQDKPSVISFDIGARKKSWDAATNVWNVFPSPRRVASVYVFCVFKELDREIANPLNVQQWEFYVVATKRLNERFPGQKRLGLNPLRRLTSSIDYEHINSAIYNSVSA